jgi:hypothetical protein
MAGTIQINESVRNILIKHAHKDTVEESLNEILKIEISRKIKKYMIMIKHFERKYNTDFTGFEKVHRGKEMNYETEKVYLDWDMAVTAVEDLKEELSQLK